MLQNRSERVRLLVTIMLFCDHIRNFSRYSSKFYVMVSNNWLSPYNGKPQLMSFHTTTCRSTIIKKIYAKALRTSVSNLVVPVIKNLNELPKGTVCGLSSAVTSHDWWMITSSSLNQLPIVVSATNLILRHVVSNVSFDTWRIKK